MRARPTIAKRGRGRPKGRVGLLNDRGRFEVAAWYAFTTGLRMRPYEAAYLVTFLASDRPITTESLDGALLKSTSLSQKGCPALGHAGRIPRKASEAIDRADAHEKAWVAYSASLILALVKFTAESKATEAAATLDLLGNAGWADTILRVTTRIDASLRSNFPPAEGPLTRAAARLLRQHTK
jgi:hypothetical protein